MNKWEAVDGRVLAWVATRRVSPVETRYWDFFARADAPFDAIGLQDLSGEEVDEALRRLVADGRIEGQRAAPIGRELPVRWTNMRATARGLNSLGEWLDLDRVATAVGVHGLLIALADAADDPKTKSLLRRAAGAAAGFADNVVRGTLAGVVSTEVREALEP